MSCSQRDLKVILALVPQTHVYFCVLGGHYGVGVGNFSTCPSGCDSPEGYWFSLI